MLGTVAGNQSSPFAVAVPGARYGLGKWRYNRPELARRFSALAIGVTTAGAAAVAFCLFIGSRLWIAFGALILLAWLILPLLLFWTGARSGWRGAWSIRLPVPMWALLPRVRTSLQSLGFDVRDDVETAKPRWLRNARAVLRLDQGIHIWLIPGVPGSRAGLDPRLQPLTTIAITGLSGSQAEHGERLRAALQEAARGL